MSSKQDTIGRTLLVALLVCLVCSIVVAVAAVTLKPEQERNKRLDRQRNILAAAGLYDPARHTEADVPELFAQFTPRLVDLRTGRLADPAELKALGIDPATYDQRQASRDPALSRALTEDEDIANIRRQARFARVYLLRDGEAIRAVVLPVHGYGLWSTLYGFLALEGDANTVIGIGFYEHGETPGLGGEVDNPKWKALWSGKKVYLEGEPALTVIKGKVGADDPNAAYKVDGLSGATLTSRGVKNLIQFWLGEQGFEPFLARIRAGEV